MNSARSMFEKFSVLKVDNYEWEEKKTPRGNTYVEHSYEVFWKEHVKTDRINAMDIKGALVTEYWDRAIKFLNDFADKIKRGEKVLETEEYHRYKKAMDNLKSIHKKHPKLAEVRTQGYASKFQDDILKRVDEKIKSSEDANMSKGKRRK